MREADAVTMALLAIRGGALRLERDGWWAGGEREAQRIPSAVVDRLRGERPIEGRPGPGGPPACRLSARGERLAADAAAERAAHERAWNLVEPLRDGPLLTLRPADGSEDVGARWCPDRGINYGPGTVQVFGGLGPDDPLTVSPVVDARAFEAALPPGEVDVSGRGPTRTVTGFHRDEEGHWVADLACGHGRHVRDDPPWVERPWIRTAEGRRSRLGALLRCARCADGEPPPERPGRHG